MMFHISVAKAKGERDQGGAPQSALCHDGRWISLLSPPNCREKRDEKRPFSGSSVVKVTGCDERRDGDE